MRKQHGAVRRHDMLAALECIFDDANSGSQDTDVPVSIYNGDLKIKISGLIDIIDKMVI